jgi:hypothetical protein
LRSARTSARGRDSKSMLSSEESGVGEHVRLDRRDGVGNPAGSTGLVKWL